MFFPTLRSTSLASAVAVSFCLTGCQLLLKPTADSAPAPQPQTASTQTPPPSAATAIAAPVPEQPASAAAPLPIDEMLTYADRLRTAAGVDITQEVARLGDGGDSPTRQMQLAIALAQTRVPADLARALGLMQRVMGASSAEAHALQPLARALAARYMEQRRIEDDRDRQAQQLRDSQRRIDQLNDRMEALRAIERSIVRPSHAPGSAPAGARPAP